MRRLPSSTASRISAEFWVESWRISLTISSERSWKVMTESTRLLHRVGADRGAVAGPHGLLADLVADLGQNLQTSRHALLHGVQGLRRLVQAEHAGERRFQGGQDGVVGREEGHGLRVDALLGVRALQHARHDDLRGVVAHRQVVREVLGDLVALLLVLGPANVLVPDQLEPGALGRLRALKIRHRAGRRLQLRFRGVELVLRRAQDFERHHLGLLQSAAEVAVGVEDHALALDLILGRAGDVEVGLLDPVEAVRDVAARNLHPDVGDPLPEVDLRVGDLIDHRLGVVADRVEPLGDLPVALADLDRLRLVADHLVEDAGLAERARDDGDPVLIEVGDLFQQAVDRRVLDLGGHQPQLAQGRSRLVEILHGRFHDDVGHQRLLAFEKPAKMRRILCCFAARAEPAVARHGRWWRGIARSGAPARAAASCIRAETMNLHGGGRGARFPSCMARPSPRRAGRGEAR